MDRVFLDANALFSVAYGSKGLRTLWNWAREGRCLLLSSAYAVEEARRNLQPRHQAQLAELIGTMAIVAEAHLAFAELLRLPEKDKPILAAAINARATHLLTGDLRHFGSLRGQFIQGVLVCTPRDYFDANPIS